MLRHSGIANAEERGKFADRALALDQLAQDQEAVAVRERLEQIAGGVGCRLHLGNIHFHSCVYTYIRIYVNQNFPASGTSQPTNGPRHDLKPQHCLPALCRNQPDSPRQAGGGRALRRVPSTAVRWPSGGGRRCKLRKAPPGPTISPCWWTYGRRGADHAA